MSLSATDPIRAFISYSHIDRKYGAQTKAALAEVGIRVFLAHDDLEVSSEWRKCIIDELKDCDLFVPLLSKSFVASAWASQEVGFIISRPEVVIAPLSIDGTTPYGFFGDRQSRMIGPEGITDDLLTVPLARHFPRQILPAMIKSAAGAKSFRGAEASMRPLVSLFPLFAPWEAEALAQAAIENGQIWSAGLCAGEYLPEFIRIKGRLLSPHTLEKLRYQITEQKWWSGPK